MNKIKYKINVMILLIIFTLIFISSNVLAIGIAPGSKTIQFQPNLEQEIGFSIINNEHKHLKVFLFVRGELKQNIILPKEAVELTPEQESVRLSYKVKLPEKIGKPGIHAAEIIALEVPEEAEGEVVVGATAAVISILNVEVPFPGKYAEATVDILGNSLDEPTTFITKVFNRGEQDIVSAKATIEIFGPTNNKITTLTTQEKSIKVRQKTELVTSWVAEDISPGPHFAVITLNYDGKEQKIAKTFDIGSLQVGIEKIEVKNFKMGDVAKFDITVENKWNQKIIDVFTQILINDEEGNLMADIKSSSENLEPLDKTELNAFWDTEGVEEGTYDTKATLYYEDQETEFLFESHIASDSLTVTPIGITGLVVADTGGVRRGSILSILVVILAIINIVWLIHFKKRNKKSK